MNQGNKKGKLLKGNALQILKNYNFPKEILQDCNTIFFIKIVFIDLFFLTFTSK